MQNESGDINADETAAVDPKIEDAEPEDQPMGGAAAEAAANSFEEKSQEPAGALDANASEELDCYDPEDPSTNIAGEQVFTEQLDDEFSDSPDMGAEGDLTKDLPDCLPSEQLVPQEFIEKQIALLSKNRFLVLYSKSWDIVENIAYVLARQWSDAAHFRYYTPDPNTANADPFSLRDVVERLTVSDLTLLIVFDHSQISFSPLVSRAYIGPRAHEFLAQLEQRKIYMLVLSKYDTVEHVRQSGNAGGLIKYFSLVEPQEQGPSEAANPPDDGLQEEALFLLWCSAFFPDLSVDDILGIVNRMIENTIQDPEMARASKQRLRKDWTAIHAGFGLSITADATGIVRFKFAMPKSSARMQELFRTKGRLDHIYALQVFLESGAMLDLEGRRSLQIAAASIAALARTDPSALGENLLLRSATASRSHPDVIQWWESDDFDPPPTALLNLLQAELVSLVRLGNSPLAAAALKALCRLRPSLVIGLLSRCPADYVYESWYLDAFIDVLRHVSRRHVRLKGLRRLIRIAGRKSHAGLQSASPSAVAGLANLTSAIYRSASQPVCGDYHSCFIDAALLGQPEQREAIHELLCSFEYSAEMAKVLAGPLRSQILLQGLFGWNWTAPRSKIDMWVKQRLLADGPPGQVFAAASALFGWQRDAADAWMKPVSPSSGVVLALLLLDHDASMSCKPDNANSPQKIPVALEALFAQEKAALRETTVALGELSRYFSACSSRMTAVTMRAGRQELETLAKIRRSLNRYAGMAVSLKKFIDKEAGK